MKLTKKILALVLSAMMVVTMLPMSAFAGSTTASQLNHSSSDSAVTAYNNAITKYESKMDGTVYKTMKPAYVAYLNAVKAYNAYLYGDADVSLATYASTLSSATDSMVSSGTLNNNSFYDWRNYDGVTSVTPVYTHNTKTGNTQSGQSYQTNNASSGFYSNIVAWDECKSSRAGKNEGSDNSGASAVFSQDNGKVNVEVYYPNMVVVYDEFVNSENQTNHAIVPVMVGIKKGVSNERYLYTVYPTQGTSVDTRPADHPFFQTIRILNNNIDYNFKGADGKNNLNFSSSRGGGSTMGSQRTAEGLYSANMGYAYNKGYWNFYATAFYINNNITFADNSKGYMDLKPRWYYTGCGKDEKDKQKNNSEYVDANIKGNQTSSHSIHVLNVKGLTDLYGTAVNKVFTDYGPYIENYKSDADGARLTEFFEGLDAANSISKTSITTANTSNAATIGATLSTAIAGLSKQGASNTGAGYAKLRNQMNLARPYYTTTSPKDFTGLENLNSAYNDAKDFMATCMSAGYHDDQAMTLANALESAIAGVSETFIPADISILMETISDARVAINNKGVFTTASYNSANLETLVPNCIHAIWGAEATYDTYGVSVKKQLQGAIDQWVIDLGESIALLQINTSAIGGYNHSLVSALALADTYTQNSGLYVNYTETLGEAIIRGTNFETKVIPDTSNPDELHAGIVADKIDEYHAVIRDIISSINGLQRAFSALANGTVINKGVEQNINQATQGNNTVIFNHPDQMVFFRTTHEPSVFNTGLAVYGFKTTQGSRDQYLDLMNFSAGSDFSTSNATGNLSVNAEPQNGSTQPRGTFSFSNMKVIQASSDTGAGKDTNGVAYSVDSNYNFANDMYEKTTDTGAPHGIVAKGGTTYFTTDSVLSLVEANHDEELTINSKPTLTEYKATSKLGCYVYYCDAKTLGSDNKGFDAFTIDYTHSAYVIDVTSLFELIDEAGKLTRTNYTTTSWNNFQEYLKAAKSNNLTNPSTGFEGSTPFDYGHMDTQAILDEVQTRYTNLFYSLRGGLKEAASNAVLREAIEYANGKKNEAGKTFTTSSVAALQAKIDEVIAYVNGEYSNDACLDLEAGQHQATINLIAKQLKDYADSLLVEAASYANLDTASGKIQMIAQNTYSVDSLNDLKDVVDDSTYLYKTNAERLDTPIEDQSAINAQATDINNAIKDLATIQVDASTFTSIKTQIDDAVKDKDAWKGVDEAKSFVDDFAADLYDDVTILDQTITGIAKSQTEINNVVTDALTKVKLQDYKIYINDVLYEVQVNGETKSSFLYGDSVTVTLPSRSDVFYAYKSNTTENAEKYFTRDNEFTFVIKGDTYLRAEPVVNTSETTYKVTYVNSLTNKVIDIHYVAKNGNDTLPTAPKMAYYELDESEPFTANGVAFDDSTIVSADTLVTVNYNATSSLPIYQITYSYTDDDNVDDKTGYYNEYVGNYEYNEAVTLHQADAIYWVTFETEEDYLAWRTGGEEADLNENIEHVVFYGDTYTFRAHEDLYIAGISQECFDDYDNVYGLIDPETIHTPEVKTADYYVDNGEKISFISTYRLDEEQYELVEAGLLVTKQSGDDLRDISQLTAKNGAKVYRLKSSQHTLGNQFVISLYTSKMPNNQEFTCLAYVIYRDKEHPENQLIVYGDNENIVYQAKA